MKDIKKLLAAVICGILLLTLVSHPVLAASVNNGAVYPVTTNEISGWPQGPDLYSETAVLMEAETGTILYNKGMDELRYPASTTKIMTALIALENSSLDEQVTFTETCLADQTPDSTHMGMKVGEVLTMEQCLMIMMIKSANDVATQIAEHVGGSVDAFVEMMNQKAQELGCANTHFANASGMPNEEHYTTAHDMALIFQEAIKNEDFRKIIGTTSYTVEPTNMTAESRTLNTSHALLAPEAPEHYEGCFGGKTGTTQIAEHTLVTGVERNGMTLITVVMRAAAGEVCQDSIQLFDYGYNNFQKVEVPGGSVIIPNGTDTESLTTVETAADGETEQDYYYNEDYYVGSGIKAETTPQTLEITQDTEEDPKEQQENDGLDDGEAEGQEGQESAAGESLYRNAMVVLAVLIGAALLVTIISAVKKKGKKKKRK